MDHLYHIPGKVFLLGEYSVLKGDPALVAAVRLNDGDGYYGFGSSTARYILDHARSHGSVDTSELWKLYRSENPHASGADLAAQSEALKNKGAVFEITAGKQLSISLIPVSPLWSSIHVFSASNKMSRKLNTDHHLRTLDAQQSYPNSKTYIERFKAAKTVSDFVLFTEWADAFAPLQLETKTAKEDRTFISSLKGVMGVKGCGAGLNDVFLVAVDSAQVPDVDGLCKLIAQERNLSYQGNLLERLWNA